MTLPVLEFSRNKTCTSCPLSANATNVCIPTSVLSSPSTADTVILVVGAKPGPEEERQGKAFAHLGQAGKYFHGVYRKYVDQKLLQHNVSVAWAVTNAVRCMPPKDANVTASQVRACHEYLIDDVKQLAQTFKRIVVLCTGEPAARSLWGTGLGAAMKRQGAATTVGDIPVVVFATANPFVLSVDPAQIHYVRDHLHMLVDFIVHGKVPMTFDVPDVGGDFDALPGTMVSIDTETYGAVAGLPTQTVFHPVKAILVDGVNKDDLVQTAAAAWLGPDGMRTRVWVLPKEERRFFQFMQRVIERKHTILGMNIPFDIKMLRALSPDWQRLLSRAAGVRLMDLSVANFLNSDIRPERSLKEIAPLLRVVQYDEAASLKKGFRYANSDDPDLQKYCVMDAAATLEAYLRLRDQTQIQFPGTARFNDRCLDWYNDVLWTVVQLDEAGVAFSRNKLQRLHDHLRYRLQRISVLVPRYFPPRTVRVKRKRKSGDVFVEQLRPAAIGGEGSAGWIVEVFSKAVDAAKLRKDDRLELTKGSGYTVPCTHKDNMNLILGVLPVGHPARKPLELIRHYRRAEKLTGTYTGPLLENLQNGLIGEMAFPSWFAVPSAVKDGEGAYGGTQQGRLTCKNPALQTMPKPIKSCMMARHPGWILLGFDLSQIELRMAALLSGDPLMLHDYQEDARLRAENLGKVDRHADTAKLIFGANADRRPDWSKLRHVGKTLNFLVLFKGGPITFQETIRRDHGLEFSFGMCMDAISAFNRKYHAFRHWQNTLLRDVCRRGYMELPITGETRTFIKGGQSMERYVAEICNFPIQTQAANVLKSAQRTIQDVFTGLHMEAVICLNIYDAIYIDCPASEESEVRRVVHNILSCPPYYSELQSVMGRTVPLMYESETICRRTPTCQDQSHPTTV